MKPFRHHHRILTATLAAALALAAACGTHSPTEPTSQPISPKVPPPVPTFVVTVTASPNHLTIGSSTNSKINVKVVNAQDGTPPPDSTVVVLTSTLGEFNSIGSGLLTVNLQTVHGSAQAVLFPGASAGTAALVATLSGAAPCTGCAGSGATNVVIGSAGTFFLSGISPNTGDPAGGALVTITGGGFVAPVSVTFGSSSANVKSVSPSAMQVIVPPSATPVPVGSTLQVSVTVNNNLGGTLAGSATLANAFTYVPGGGGIQQPQIFSVSPASGTNSGGTQVTILGQNFVSPVQVFFGSGASATSFNGIEATIQSVTASQIIVVTPPAQGFGQNNTNQLVSILVKNVGSGFSTIDTAAFTYGSKVLVTSAGPTTTVFNQQVKVTIFGQGFQDPVAVSLAGIAAQVLSTSGTEIQVLSGIPAISTCANVAGPVTVTNINNGDSNSGPTFTYLVTKPAIFNVSPPTGNQNGGTKLTIGGIFIDPGQTQVQIGQQAAFATPGLTSTVNDLFVTTPPFSGTFPTQPCTSGGLTGTMNVGQVESVTVTDAITSCTTTLAGAFTFEPTDTSCQVTVAPPTASFVFSIPKGSFTVTFTDTSSGNPTGWSWEFGDGGTSAQQNPTHTYAVAGTYTVVLRASNSGGTGAPTTQQVTVPGS
jgi:PKD repeat protein